MRNKIIIPAILALAAALAWAGYTYLGNSHAQTAVQHAPNPPAVPVTAGVAETRDMPVYVRGIGNVQAYNTLTVKSRVDGQITKVGFTEGQDVKTGDLLFEIDPRPFQAALAQAKANKEKDEALLVSALADLKRDEELVGHGFQTRQAYDAQKALVGQLQASIKADQAQIETAQLNIQYAEIRAPFDGRAGARLVDIGNLVRATDNIALVTITQLRPIFISFTVPQNQFATIRHSAQGGTVEVDAFSEDDKTRLAAGKLTLIDNQIDQATGTIHLKGTFSNENETLWPGAFINVRLVVGIRKNAVTVPASAVQRGPNGSYVFVIKPDMTVELRDVDIAETEEDIAAVSKGLAAGERIVLEGQYRLEPGSKVVLQKPASAPGTERS